MRHIYLFLCLILAVIANAQQVMDAYLMFPMQTQGSARIAAMGGSANALGGDISTLFQNPAGLSQFRTNEVVFSPGFRLNQVKTKYDDKDFSNEKNILNIGAFGIVMSTAHYKKNKLVRTNWGIAFNQTANFNSRLQFNGVNQTGSFSEKWVEELEENLKENNIRSFDDALFFSPAGASLAVENFLVDSILDNNVITGYRSNANKNAPFSLSQSFSQQISGSANELALGFSRNQSEKFFYGMTLGIPFFRRLETLTVEEKDLSGNTDNDFEQFRFTETISTTGTGFLLRAGLLYKPIDRVRIGLNLQSPSFYTLTRSIDARLETSVENYARRIDTITRPQQFSASTQDITGGSDYSYDYQVITPWTAAIAIAYVFRETENVKQQRGMITAEAEFVNHRGTRFSSAQDNNNAAFDQYFQTLNNQIRSFYRPALNFRVGGELKFNTLMFRGGFQYLQSPFEKRQKESFGIKGYRLTPSIGVGYRDKGIFVDLTYSHLMGDQIYFPYVLTDNAYPFARSRVRNGQLLATVGFKF